MWLQPQTNMQPPARFRPQQYNSSDLVRHPNTAEPTSRALYFVSPCSVQRRSTKSADPALRYYYPYCFNQLVCMFPTLHDAVLEEERSNRGGDLVGSEKRCQGCGPQVQCYTRDIGNRNLCTCTAKVWENVERWDWWRYDVTDRFGKMRWGGTVGRIWSCEMIGLVGTPLGEYLLVLVSLWFFSGSWLRSFLSQLHNMTDRKFCASWENIFVAWSRDAPTGTVNEEVHPFGPQYYRSWKLESRRNMSQFVTTYDFGFSPKAQKKFQSIAGFLSKPQYCFLSRSSHFTQALASKLML